MITSWEQFYELERVTWEAQDRLTTGSGQSGIHYDLLYILRGLGVFANGREDGIKQAKRILSEWETAQAAE